jgi:hypothetical protein
MQVLNRFDYPSVFIDVGENLITTDDVTTPSNPLVTPIKKEELEKTSFDVNVSQQSHEKKLV